MRQHRWLDVVKDYECEILYHPGKANIVVDTLSRNVTSALIRDLCLIMKVVTPLLKRIHEARVEVRART